MIKKLLLALASAFGIGLFCTPPPASAATWTYVQDSTITYCSSGTSCGAFSGTMIPTQSGTVWVFYIDTASATSASVSGGGATWTECVSCRVSVTNHHAFVFYAFGGTAGSTNFTISAPGNSGSLSVQFAEIQPPAGSTASFDVGTGSSVSCGGTPATCVGPSLALSATDFVMNFLDGTAPGSWNGWPSPWLTLPSGDGALVNATGTVAAPTVTVRPGFAGTAVFSAIAFKSTAGSFTPPASGPISIASFSVPDPASGLSGLNCAPTCSLTLSSATSAGHLFYLEAADTSGVFLSSVSGGGTWTVPASCQIKGGAAAGNALSCAYVLSSTGSVSSINITMAGTANTQFAFYEVATTVGSFSLDVIGTATNAASFQPSGVSLSLASGGNDVVFQSILINGGTSGVSFYPYIRGCRSGCGPGFWNGQAASDAILNIPGGTTAPVAQWTDQQNNSTVVSGVAFKASLPVINAATCNTSDVQAALNAVAVDGTIVSIPAGACTWTTAISYNQTFSTTIQGTSTVATTNAQGNPATFNDSTKITDGSTGGNPLFPIPTGASGKVLRVTGLSIQGPAGGNVFNGEFQLTGSGQFRIDHCHFININVLAIRVFVNGVADHNLFDVPTTTVWNGISVMRNNNGDLEWSQNTGFGTSDFVFIENNTFNNGFPNDCNQGGKYVARFNTLVTQGNSSFQEHATGSVQNPPWRGCRAYEVYGNVVSSTQVGGSFVVEFQISSTGLSWNNTSTGFGHLIALLIDRDQVQSNFTQTAPPNGWGYCGTFQTGVTSSWDGNLNSNGSNGWPCMDQPGRGKGDLLSTNSFPNVTNTVLGGQTYPRQALEPVYSWMENFTPTPPGASLFTVTSPNNNIQNDRDYYQPISPFTGASGTGFGLLSARPATCTAGSGGNTPGVAFWATDTNTLYVCNPVNTWTVYYTPFTYPHPLTVSSGSTLAPPTNLHVIPNVQPM